MKAKRILSIILCIATLISALSLTAFAQEQEPFAEIKFRNPEAKTIEFGKTEELYLEYGTGEIEAHKIEWEISKKNRCEIEFVTDEETGLVTGAKLTGKNFGSVTLTVRILDENGNEIISAKKTTGVVESEDENKTFKEKLKIFFKDSNAGLFMTMMYIVIPLAGSVILAPYNAVRAIIYSFEKLITSIDS